MPTGNQIFSDTLGSVNNGWQDYNNFVVCGTANLVAKQTGTAFVRVTLSMATGTSGATLQSLWVGEQQSSPVNPYNFDGNQVQLTFNGSTSLTGITGAGNIISDGVAFNYTGTGTPLVVRMYWANVGTPNAADNTSSTNNNNYYLSSGTDYSGVTAPAPAFASVTGRNVFVLAVEMIDILQSQACL